MSLLKHVVQSDPDTQARQAAVTVIKQLFKGLDRDTVQVSTSSIELIIMYIHCTKQGKPFFVNSVVLS